jgi:lipoic acid synthetase
MTLPVERESPESQPLAWRPRLPSHLKQPVALGNKYFRLLDRLGRSGIATVCEEAKCPNRSECWSRGTLTFQILGSICTRRCGFCAETTGRPMASDPSEPERLAEAVRGLTLSHVVITSPARDDMPDQGAGQFSACIRTLREKAPGVTVEVLIPDFQGRPDLLEIVFAAKPDILNHNMETVRRLTPRVRSRATYDRSLDVLRRASEAGLLAKSGVMVGLGETMDELLEAFGDMKSHGVRFLTVGQYLPPSPKHYAVQKFYSPEEFDDLRAAAAPFFDHVVAGPLVRSSYHADEFPKELLKR